jgi:hypothetical protein
MEIVPIDQPFEAQAGHIRSRPRSITPVAVDPRAVNIKSECRSEKTKKRPIEPVIDNVAAGHWTLKACEIWQDRFVGHGRIIKRKCTGKESVARNSVRMGGMHASEHRQHDQQAPWQHGITPRSGLSTLFDRLKKTTFKLSPRHYCLALCLFGIGPERLRTAYIRIGVSRQIHVTSAAAAESGYECRLADATSGEQRASSAAKQVIRLICFMWPRPSN